MNKNLPHNYILLIVLQLLLLLPFLLLAFFAWPSSDDYSMTYIMAERGLSSYGVAVMLYGEWGGRYSTLLGALLSPVVVEHLWLYRAILLLSLMVLMASLIWFWKGLFSSETATGKPLLVALAFLLLWFQIMPCSASSLYWYSGLVVYTWPLILFFFLAGGLIRGSSTVLIKLLLVPAAFLLVGFNEMAAVLAFLLVATWWLLTGRKKDTWLMILLLLAITAGLLLLLLSPGNAKRMDLFVNNSNLWDALRISLVSLAKLNGIHLQSISLWLIVLMVFPWLHRWPVRGVGNRLLTRLRLIRLAGHPVCVFVVGQFILLGLLFIPAWSMGINPPLRVYNFLSPLWLLWLVGMLIAVRQHYGKNVLKGWPVFQGRGLKALVLLIALSLMVNFVKIPGREVVFGGNVPHAWYDLALHAAPYNRAMRERAGIVEKAMLWGKPHEVVFPALQNPPQTIFFLDIQPDAEHWINMLYARYYGVEKIRVDDGETR